MSQSFADKTEYQTECSPSYILRPTCPSQRSRDWEHRHGRHPGGKGEGVGTAELTVAITRSVWQQVKVTKHKHLVWRFIYSVISSEPLIRFDRVWNDAKGTTHSNSSNHLLYVHTVTHTWKCTIKPTCMFLLCAPQPPLNTFALLFRVENLEWHNTLNTIMKIMRQSKSKSEKYLIKKSMKTRTHHLCMKAKL